MVRVMANLLLATTSTDTVGKNWVTNYIRRTPALQTRFSRRYDYSRALQEDPRIIREWFKRVEDIITEYGILSEDIYNFDETGFAMGLVASAKVVTRAGYYGRRSVIQPGSREWVTMIEAINACGWVIPPTIILKGKRFIESWFCIDIPDDWRLEISDSGWTDDAIGLRWLQKQFIPATTSRLRGRYRLLILDGHASHLTPQFDRICAANDIIPICMPAHSSHLLQPLDVGCFAVLKRSYSTLVDQQTRDGKHHIDKLDFLSAYPHARTDAFKMNTILNAFKATGIVPLDAEPVLSKLNVQIRTPTPVSRPSSRSSVYCPQTPSNIKQLDKHEASTKRVLKFQSASPPRPEKDQVKQVYKACAIYAKDNLILHDEVHRLRAELDKKARKKALPKRRIEREEGLSVGEAHEQGIGILHTIEGGAVVSAAPTRRGVETSDATKRRQYLCGKCRRPGHRAYACTEVV
jgi:hypothetical protein